MPRELAFDVLVRQKDGSRVRVPAGTADTDPRTKGITNPVAWKSDDDATVAETAAPAAKPAKKAAAKRTSKKAAADEAPDGGDADGDTPPDAAGAVERPADDADAETWATYARSLGQDVADDADTAAIVAQLDAAGLLEQ